MKPSMLKQFERSVCGCSQCKAPCQVMPGMMAPGDLNPILEECGYTMDSPIEQVEEFLLEHFVASDGAVVMDTDGNVHRIPTITPSVNEKGCVFLDAEGNCSIHSVSPYGCRNFNVCGGDDHDDFKVKAALAAIAKDPEYEAMHKWLLSNGKTSRPLSERKRKLHQLLDKIHEETD